MSSWNNVVYSTTHATFKENWDEFELTYKGKGDAIEYIKDTWFSCKEKFVSAWTEKYLHFGNRASSRAEGAHAKLKLYLQACTGGFREVKQKISHAVEHEFKEIKVKLASERIQVPHDCNIPFFREVLSHVSKFALKEIYKQYEKVKEGTINPCTGHYTATMGLPCAHKIAQWEGMSLPLDLINSHWRIDTLSLNSEDVVDNDDANRFVTLVNELSSRYQGWPLYKQEYATLMITNLLNESEIFFEPVVQRPKGRPPKSKKKKGKTSTKRDPSRFEYVESSQAHNPSSSNCVSQRNNELMDESSYMHHENNLIDLNVYSDFTSEFMSLE
ncbi:hypothetical protein CTI12_AA414210 [Artemisia annua]|uniref:Uncharacterized protein n=1 Tax=Artemisia annua TaxID=35608 RepID=A0A2U1M6J7_ARTAN|nr:hypothetical protein CTI12_AA414210 [Artemisia annua]